jgi:hypothetical protein
VSARTGGVDHSSIRQRTDRHGFMSARVKSYRHVSPSQTKSILEGKSSKSVPLQSSQPKVSRPRHKRRETPHHRKVVSATARKHLDESDGSSGKETVEGAGSTKKTLRRSISARDRTSSGVFPSSSAGSWSQLQTSEQVDVENSVSELGISTTIDDIFPMRMRRWIDVKHLPFSNALRRVALRKKFVRKALSYIGVPYAKKYHEPRGTLF